MGRSHPTRSILWHRTAHLLLWGRFQKANSYRFSRRDTTRKKTRVRHYCLDRKGTPSKPTRYHKISESGYMFATPSRTVPMWGDMYTLRVSFRAYSQSCFLFPSEVSHTFSREACIFMTRRKHDSSETKTCKTKYTLHTVRSGDAFYHRKIYGRKTCGHYFSWCVSRYAFSHTHDSDTRRYVCPRECPYSSRAYTELESDRTMSISYGYRNAETPLV